MKKIYTPAELEIVKLGKNDVIATSGDGNDAPADTNPNYPFGGGYDSSGWT